jgi:SsrA-binding protein
MARPTGTKLIAANRRARRNYEILETVEAGLVLRGSEVKSLRDAHVQLGDAYARRKLLLHRGEIDRLRSIVDEQRLALIPLSLYFKEGRAKVELALARGRKTYDKREVLAKRDAEREAARAMARADRR